MGRARGGGEWGARAAAANGAQAQARGEGGREGGSGRLSQNKKSSVGSDVLTPDPVLSPLPPVAGLLHRYYSTCVVWRRPASYASDPRLRSNKSNNAHTLTHLTHSISVYLPPMGVDVVSVYVSVFCDTPLNEHPTCKKGPLPRLRLEGWKVGGGGCLSVRPVHWHQILCVLATCPSHSWVLGEVPLHSL